MGLSFSPLNHLVQYFKIIVLWDVKVLSDRMTLYIFLAWQYLILPSRDRHPVKRVIFATEVTYEKAKNTEHAIT